MPTDGVELIRRMTGGDRDALAEFYDAYAPLAFGLVRRILHDAADAEEVLQELFWEIWRSVDDYEADRGSPEAWVVGRARSRAIDRARSTRRSGEMMTAVARAAPEREPGRDERGAIRGALGRLPQNQQEIIELAYFDGLTQAEISGRLKQPLGTVKTRMRLAMEKLRSLGGRGVSPSHEPYGELASAYALGALAGEELTRFRAHLAQACGQCERALAEYREALVLPAADLREAPPPGVKRALMERAGRWHRRSGAPRFWPGLKWAASVVIAAGVLASVTSVFVSARYEMRIGRMAREVAALREQVARERQALALLRDPATRVVTLTGLDPSPKARGRLIWNERDGGVFVAAGLPPAPPGRAYQLWAIAGGQPVRAAVFTVDAEGAGGARVAPLAGGRKADQFGVTLESSGGAPAPTGPMLLASR